MLFSSLFSSFFCRLSGTQLLLFFPAKRNLIASTLRCMEGISTLYISIELIRKRGCKEPSTSCPENLKPELSPCISWPGMPFANFSISRLAQIIIVSFLQRTEQKCQRWTFPDQVLVHVILYQGGQKKEVTKWHNCCREDKPYPLDLDILDLVSRIAGVLNDIVGR